LRTGHAQDVVDDFADGLGATKRAWQNKSLDINAHLSGRVLCIHSHRFGVHESALVFGKESASAAIMPVNFLERSVHLTDQLVSDFYHSFSFVRSAVVRTTFP
jgi:hypothetical protein